MWYPTVNLSSADRALLSAISTKLDSIIKGDAKMATALDTLTAQVKANTDVEQSAIVLINGISAALAAAKTDPVAIQALADSLKTSSDSLAADIVANTPAAN
jgi:hypothetical protein